MTQRSRKATRKSVANAPRHQQSPTNQQSQMRRCFVFLHDINSNLCADNHCHIIPCSIKLLQVIPGVNIEGCNKPDDTVGNGKRRQRKFVMEVYDGSEEEGSDSEKDGDDDDEVIKVSNKEKDSEDEEDSDYIVYDGSEGEGSESEKEESDSDYETSDYKRILKKRINGKLIPRVKKTDEYEALDMKRTKKLNKKKHDRLNKKKAQTPKKKKPKAHRDKKDRPKRKSERLANEDVDFSEEHLFKDFPEESRPYRIFRLPLRMKSKRLSNASFDFSEAGLV